MDSVDPRIIHRKFVFRICSMSLIIAIIVGTGVWQTGKNKIGQDILWSAKVSFKHLNNRILTLLNNPEDLNPKLIQHQIVTAMSEPRSNQLGWFVSVGKIRARAIRLAGASILIVLLTTGLLYPVVVTLLNRVSSLSARLFEANLEMLNVLGSAVAKRDSDTDSHNYRVTIISVKLAEILGLSKQKIQRLIKGAFLHDVGKIGIEDDILHKPGSLSEDEFTAMKNHVPYGVDIVTRAEWIKEAADIVEYHHEKYDGSGYGNGTSL